ncbi:MAG: dihydrolipoamide acetyltransferase [Porticoccaceae bacterium]|nr:dihydrolipoamide acetyltransferase [Porticoccaceae bacterium]MBT5003805.1 dihydrolipoamide acetyltransferase [Porticoccaceae bacterium]
MAIEIIKVPDLGGAETVDVIELSLAQGDNIAAEDSLVVLESDKATMDVPSPRAGQLIKYLVAEGDTVKVGDSIAELEISSSESPAEVQLEQPVMIEEVEPKIEAPVSELKSEPAPGPVTTEPVAAITNVESSGDSGAEGEVYAGPSVRLMARELGVTLDSVVGSGPRGRIIKDDIDAYVKGKLNSAASNELAKGSAIPSTPSIDFSQFGPIDTVKLTKIQKLTASNMHRNWLNVPHVTHFDDADITNLESFRKSLKVEGEVRGVRITPVAFIIKAIATALDTNPVINRSLASDGEHYIQKSYCNIGMAVDTPRGLVVPVIRNANEKGIWEIAADVANFAAKARDGKLKPIDMQGGCFSLSSLGTIGGNGFTPIVNAPEVGILGVSKSQMKPVWNGDAFEPRLMLPLALSYDHRLVNGGDAGRFMTDIVKFLSDIRHLAL